MEDLFTAFNDDVRHVVRQTANMAVVTSQEEQLTDGDSSVSVSHCTLRFSPWGFGGGGGGDVFLRITQR